MVQTSTVDLSRSGQHRHLGEGELTQRMEQQQLRVPGTTYLVLALGSMVVSAILAVFSERKEWANFVGLWAPSFLLMGIHNKLVRIENPESISSVRRAA